MHWNTGALSGIFSCTMKGLIILMMLLSSTAVLTANDPPSLEEVDAALKLDVSSPGGTPLLLEFSLEDPEGYALRAEIDFGTNGVIDYALSLTDLEEDQPFYRGIPFRGFAAVHRMHIYLHTEAGVITRAVEIAFADYQWGRDNLSFANDNRFRDTAGAISVYLLEWARSRFGSISDEETSLLVSLMYRLFRGNIGRCYGFSSLGLYYQAHPYSISGDYAWAYELDEKDPEVQSLIHMLQHDIVYHIFSTGEISPDLDHELEDLSIQRGEIMTALQAGRPVVLGYLSSRTHHSMVVYGYIHLIEQDRLVLTAGNNWNRDQWNNMDSEDAKLLDLYNKDGIYRLDWLTYTHRDHDRVFVIDPIRSYSPRRDVLEALLEDEKERIRKSGKHRIILEHPRWAYLADEDDRKRGYDGTRHWWGFPGVDYRRFDDIFIFDIPPDVEAELFFGGESWNTRLEKPKEIHLAAALVKEGQLEAAVVRDIRLGDDEQMVLKLEYPLQLR